jgi:hypothetical protein
MSHGVFKHRLGIMSRTGWTVAIFKKRLMLSDVKGFQLSYKQQPRLQEGENGISPFLTQEEPQ